MKKKRNKKYRPKYEDVHHSIRNERFFARPMKLLRDIRHGEVWQVGDRLASVMEDDSDPMPATDVLRYFARFIVDIGAERGYAIDTMPIVRLAARLDADMPVDDAALRPAEEIFELARRLSAPIPTSRMLEILTNQETEAA